MAPNTASAHEATPQSAARRRVLLVEDDPDAALFASHILTRRGAFDVTHTSDPVVALALAAAQSWDLVLTDFDLPGLSGLELVATLRRILPGLPVVLLTANPRDAWQHFVDDKCRPDAVLAKPVLPDDLLATLSTLISEGLVWEQ